MNANDLNAVLYEKMVAEQNKYRDWLKKQPLEEILHYAYEYAVREDIVIAMEELELTDVQAKALLESPSPLADVCRYFRKLETGYMDVIRESIENLAKEMCRVKEKLCATPIYYHTAVYASEHGELVQYNASNRANLICKEVIEEAINAHYRGNWLDTDTAVKEVLERFGPERVQYILANTVQRKDWDARISSDNKAWAKTVPMPKDNSSSRQSSYLVVDQVNPGLLDLFIKQMREIIQKPERRSDLQKHKQKPAAQKKWEPER